MDVPADTPVTTPVEATVATPVELELHVPPPAASVRLVVVPTHSVGVPVIVPATGSGFTVMVLVAVKVPQLFVKVYDMTAVPPDTPDTIPVEPIVAIPVDPELHTPPVVASLNAIVAPAQTEDAPLIVPADVAVTVTTSIALTLPQLFVAV